MRLGSYMKSLIAGNLESWEAERLLNKAGKQVEKTMDGHESFHTVVSALDEMVHERANDVIVKARQAGDDAKAVSVCCHRANCGLCLGKYSSHYPTFYVGGRKVKDPTPFLSRFKEGEDVISFLRLCEVRNQALILFNYQQRLFVRLGLLKEETE